MPLKTSQTTHPLNENINIHRNSCPLNFQVSNNIQKANNQNSLSKERYNIEYSTKRRKIKKKRDDRTVFSRQQIGILRSTFQRNPILSESVSVELSKILSIPIKTIKIWWQNFRAKIKKLGLLSQFLNQNQSLSQQNSLTTLSPERLELPTPDNNIYYNLDQTNISYPQFKVNIY